MATEEHKHSLTLGDFAKRLDPDGRSADVADLLQQTNEMLRGKRQRRIRKETCRNERCLGPIWQEEEPKFGLCPSCYAAAKMGASLGWPLALFIAGVVAAILHALR